MVTLGLSVNISNDCEELSPDFFGNEICIHKDNGLICVNTCNTSNPSLPYTLGSVGVQMDEVQVVSLSFAGQPWMITDTLRKKVKKRLGLKDHQEVVIVPSQEISYAYTSHFTSGLDKTLLIITSKEDELGSKPRISYYMANGSEVEWIDQDFPGQEDISFSSIYQKLAEYLNLEDSMEIQRLALYGKGKYQGAPDLWFLDENLHIHSNFSNLLGNPCELKEVLSSVGIDIPSPRQLDEPLLEEHAEVAQYVQNQVEAVFSRKIAQLLDKHPAAKVCITGEITCNHLLLNQLSTSLPTQVYVPPMDYCQNLSVGNTIYALLHTGDKQVDLGELKLNFKMENIYRTYLCCCS